MPTTYDVFAKLVEKAPCKAKDLEFKTPVYAHIRKLEKLGWISKRNNRLNPIKNKETTLAFETIRYCMNHGLDYNILLKASMKQILKYLPRSLPELRPEKLKNKKDIQETLNYLEENQFILKYSKRPALGRLLKHHITRILSELHKTELKIKATKDPDLIPKILKIKTEQPNPFKKETFSFLAGSAQLEGSTITEGDTQQMLLYDIYPDKPAKDIQMVKNLNESLKYILDNKNEDITPEKIKEINNLVLFSMHANAGNYKLSPNKIHGNPAFKTASPEKVPSLMEDLCNSLKKINTKKELLQRMGELHNNLQRIHPFSDGNSRTTRMTLNWLMIKQDLPIIILKMGIFDEYMNLTKLSSQRDDKALNQLFLEAITHENLEK